MKAYLPFVIALIFALAVFWLASLGGYGNVDRVGASAWVFLLVTLVTIPLIGGLRRRA